MGYWTAFILGLAGSLHCAGMCGPIALILPKGSGGRRAFAVGRLAYHLGRATTYVALGAVFGLIGKGFLVTGAQRGASIALGIGILASLFLSPKINLASRTARAAHGLQAALAGWLRRRGYRALYVTGALNGLLPCGLVYAACAAAAVSRGPLEGALYMAAFGLGTLPMMLAISMSRLPLPLSLRLRHRSWMPAAMAILALLLILRGLSLGIPFVSPDMNSETAAPCH